MIQSMGRVQYSLMFILYRVINYNVINAECHYNKRSLTYLLTYLLILNLPCGSKWKIYNMTTSCHVVNCEGISLIMSAQQSLKAEYSTIVWIGGNCDIILHSFLTFCQNIETSIRNSTIDKDNREIDQNNGFKSYKYNHIKRIANR